MTYQTLLIRFLLLVLLTIFITCKPSTHQSNQVKAIRKTDSCATENMHKYRIYLPSLSTDCKKLPLLLVIDPHADTALAMNTFIQGAEEYKMIVAVSAVLKNNYSDFAQAINMLIDDIRSKYPVNQSVYLAGFSGGARMALTFAKYMHVDGVIACGAFATPQEIDAIKSPVVGITGMSDFNFIETAQYIFRPELMPPNLILELTEDTHTWPSPYYLSCALGYLNAYDSDNTPCGASKNWKKKYAHKSKLQFDSLLMNGEILNAGIMAINLSGNNEINDIENFTIAKQKVLNSQEYKAILDQLKESIRFELAMRNIYNNAFQTNDTLWWANEIESLKSKIAEDQDYFRGFAYQRIKGFIGIMCYSLCENSLHKNELKNTKQFLQIYKLIEPENADMFYFHALYYHRINRPEDALKHLVKAIDAGFTDSKRISEDFKGVESIQFLSSLSI